MISRSPRLFRGLLVSLHLLAFVLPARAVQFRLLGWAAQDLNLCFDTGKTSNELYLSTEAFSPAYEFAEAGPIVFYKQVEREGASVKQVACTVVIPPGLEKGILLLVPGDESKAAYRKVLPDRHGFVSERAPLIYDYVWIDDSPAARPPGTIEFRNLSRRSIAFQLEQHRQVLAPNAKVQLPLARGAKRMAFHGAAEVDGQWKVFTQSPLPTRGPERMMVILRDGIESDPRASPDRANIKMISLFDWPAPPAAPPPLAAGRR